MTLEPGDYDEPSDSAAMVPLFALALIALGVLAMVMFAGPLASPSDAAGEEPTRNMVRP